MRQYPAIAVLEVSGIPLGISVADKMVKNSPVTVLKSGTVHQGKFIILVGGSVASVNEAFNTGLYEAGDSIIDMVNLSSVHDQVHDSILGERRKCSGDALGVIETATVASVIKSADSAVKETDINIMEIRLADDLDGKGLAIFSGKVEEIEAAVGISRKVISNSKFWLSHIIIPSLADEIKKQIEISTKFSLNSLEKLKSGEI